MTDLDRALLEAWAKVKPKLDADPDELRRRLARRRRPTMMRPPRAWCVALRASDTRITPYTVAIAPEWAVELPNPVSTKYRQPHTVTLTKALLQKLCAPVRLASPHEDHRDVMRYLGAGRTSLDCARRRGVLSVERYPGLFGRSGPPVPVLYSRQLLDPQAGQSYQRPDPVWGTLWQFLPNYLPNDFEQTLTRQPQYGRGHAAARAGALDLEEFRGWRWVCPGCRKTARTIFYPIPPVNFPEMLRIDPVRDEADADARPPMSPCFACARCHNVVYLSRVSGMGWNHFVSHISAGLLYGSEVPRPAWFTPDRKRAYHPHPGRAPSKGLEEVRERLLMGWTYRRIAQDLGVSVKAVWTRAEAIYKHHRVRRRAEFLRAAGVALPDDLTRNEQVLPLLCAGRPYAEIARELGITFAAVANRVRTLCRKHRVSGRAELVMKHRHRTRYARGLPAPREVPAPRAGEGLVLSSAA